MKLFRWERKVGALQVENLWRGGGSHYGGTKQREDSGCQEIKAIQVLQQQGGSLSRVNWATRLQRWRSALRGCRKAYWWREDEGERWWSCRAELTRVIVYHSPIPWKQAITSSAASWCLQQLASEWGTPIVSYCTEHNALRNRWGEGCCEGKMLYVAHDQHCLHASLCVSVARN